MRGNCNQASQALLEGVIYVCFQPLRTLGVVRNRVRSAGEFHGCAQAVRTNVWSSGRKHVLNASKLACVLLGFSMLIACGSPERAKSNVAAFIPAQPTAVAAPPPAAENLSTRLALLNQAVTRWQQAPTLRVAHEAAEEARNLVVGSHGPFYGDANGDGKISGAKSSGILPGLKSEAGLVASNANSCIIADVLGGRWSDPARRWSLLQRAIVSWTPAKNTFPSLPSHPQRVVGWASLTLKSSKLVDAHEFASHARLHVDISQRALNNCRR